MQTTLRSQELSCPSCVSKIEKMLTGTEGVRDATVHFNTGRIEVEYDADAVTEDDLTRVVQRAGYDAEVSAF
ncbi:MAG: heavy-metal-associated domain-containing protein [Candidatus Bipolaricaulia bacterium]